MTDQQPVRIIGLEELIKDIHDRRFITIPARKFLEKWGSRVQRSAVANIKRGPGGWVNEGQTRGSLTHETDTAEMPLWARAGSNLKTARFGEYGTGLLSEDPESSKTRHWPPASALDDWAAKKQIPKKNAKGEPTGEVMTGADIARIIGLRGGLAPRRFLRDAVESTESLIPKYLGQFADEIEQEAERAH